VDVLFQDLDSWWLGFHQRDKEVYDLLSLNITISIFVSSLIDVIELFLVWA
jgi:hypothetical protein